tara:strand:- start:19204 stop:19839 length:636 start_codon:yes stop_codon:yes gene_type:complete
VQLIVFDFDGTLSGGEMIVELAMEVGQGPQINEITEKSMRGEINFAESLSLRTGLLKGLSEKNAGAVYQKTCLRPGMGELLEELKDKNLKIAIITGGFLEGVENALLNLDVDVDWIVANDLMVERGCLTGEVKGEFLHRSKREALEKICTIAEIPIEEVIAVGDGANDIPMLEMAGFSIGFKPKMIVSEYCDVVVETVDELKEALVERNIL